MHLMGIVNKEIVEILCLILSGGLKTIPQSLCVLMYILFLEFGCLSRCSEEQQQPFGA